MAILTRAGMITDCRLHAQDDNTAGNGLTDAQWTTLLNEVMQAFASAFPEHFIIRDDLKSVTFASGIGSWTPTNASYNVRRVLAMRIGTINLERFEPHRIYNMQVNDPTAGTSTRYALVHDNSSAVMTTKPNTFTILLYPIPTDGGYTIGTDYEFYPIDLSGDTDLPRGFGDIDSRWIVLIAAARGAQLNGKDQAFIEQILSPIPDEIATRVNVRRGLLVPRVRPEEVPI